MDTTDPTAPSPPHAPPHAPPAQRPLRERLRAVLSALTAGLVERSDPAHLALLAALAGEHLLLLGPPGTAKSELARRLRGAFRGARYFERLLTRFSVPEELFGPLSIRALERDEYLRLTEGYLPSAHVAFLDEVFKANSAILNALLGMLNEREFDNGALRVRVPLVCVVAASNEVPEGDELRALYDRFLLRCHVGPVSPAGFDALLALPCDAGAGAPPALDDPSLLLDEGDLARVREGAARVRLPDGVRELLAAARAFLAEKQVYVSDRRWRKIAGLLRVAAYTDGRDAVALADCALVRHCAWERPEQQGVLGEWFTRRLDQALADEPRRYEAVLHALERAREGEAGRRAQRVDGAGRPLYVGDDGAPTPEEFRRTRRKNDAGEVLFVRPAAGQPAGSPGQGWRAHCTMRELFAEHFRNDVDALERYVADPAHHVVDEARREPILVPLEHDGSHVAARVRQVEDVLADLTSLARAVDAHLRAGGDAAHDAAAAPLWGTGRADAEARHKLEVCRKRLLPLVARATALHDAFAALRARPA